MSTTAQRSVLRDAQLVLLLLVELLRLLLPAYVKETVHAVQPMEWVR